MRGKLVGGWQEMEALVPTRTVTTDSSGVACPSGSSNTGCQGGMLEDSNVETRPGDRVPRPEGTARHKGRQEAQLRGLGVLWGIGWDLGTPCPPLHSCRPEFVATVSA